MAQKCAVCGSAVTSTGTDRFTCLVCGANQPFVEPEDRGRVENPDGPAEYYGDDGVTYHGDPEPADKKR